MDRARQKLLVVSATGLLVVVSLIAVAMVRSFVMGGAPTAARGATGGRPLSARAQEAVLASARSYLQKNEPGKAEAILHQAIEQAPLQQDLRTLDAETLLQLGRANEAYIEYLQAIAIGPDHPELEHVAGSVANSIGKLQESLEHFWRAQQLAPGEAKYPIYLAQIQRKLGKRDEAKKSLAIAGRLAPDTAIVWGTLASISLDENKLSVGMGHIKRARALEPNSIAWRLIEAKLLRRSAEPKKALRLLGALNEEHRLGDANVLREMALCYGLLREPSKAADLYAQAVDRRSDDAALALEAARWSERAGELDAARSFAQRAKALGDAEALPILQRLAESDG